MTNRELQEFADALKTFSAKHSKTPAQARKILRDEGVIDKYGKLRKPYTRAASKKLAKASWLHRLTTSFVLAYHGCDKSVADELLRDEKFRNSENAYDWLRSGVYF
jgi:hypothetical protein